MVGAGTFWRQQQENQINRLIVQRFEIDRRFKTCENTGDLLDAVELAMGNGNAVPHTGGTELFTLEDDVEHFPFRDSGNSGCLCGQLLKQLLFGIHLEGGNNRILLQQICQRHSLFPSCHRDEAEGRCTFASCLPRLVRLFSS